MSARIVSVRLWGGLCNRLFQIACCYGYAEKYNITPVFYKSFFNHNDHTNQDETIAILKELIPHIQISNEPVNENNFYIIEVCGDLACKYIDLELPPNDYANKNILLKGYFQSEKYFPILEANKFLVPFVNKLLTPDNLNKYFIHIRLGDYEGHYIHYLGYRNYLQKAIEYILEKDSNAMFLICSNEKDKNKILKEIDFYSGETNSILSRIKYEFEIDINPDLHPLQTLKNMALCNGGGICLNSSFSWFGAYLSKLFKKVSSNLGNDILGEQIFIMPDKWFNERYIPKDSYKDIYPEWPDLTTCNI
jgi:hypothetical protein